MVDRLHLSTGKAQLRASLGLATAALLFATIGTGPRDGATASAPALPHPPAGGEMGFIVTKFFAPVYNGDMKEDCPDGELGVLRDSYLRTLPVAERERLNRGENATELDRKWKAYSFGPNGTNICSNVREFLDRPPTPMMKGKISWGLNLDGDVSGKGADDYTCKHEDFTSPTGEKGIDNQFWRVQGCNISFRGPDNDTSGAEYRRAYNDMLMTGQNSQVILLRGVDSLVNDPDVEVVYANTDDRPVTSSTGQVINNASYTVSENGRKATYRNVLHGRISKGVLTTDPKRIVLHLGVQGGMQSQWDLDRGRLRLEFQPDGSVKGLAGGYMPLLMEMTTPRAGGAGSAQIGGIDCAGQYAAFRLMADGDKDPKTGQCRRISYAYEVNAVPAFVNDVAPSKSTAGR